jgi:hypothetical protein
MKKALAIVLLTASFAAAASCPISAPYRCVPGWNGKQICGCGV